MKYSNFLKTPLQSQNKKFRKRPNLASLNSKPTTKRLFLASYFVDVLTIFVFCYLGNGTSSTSLKDCETNNLVFLTDLQLWKAISLRESSKI